MCELHDLWSVSPHGSLSCKNYMIFDLYLMVHVRTTSSLIWYYSHGSVFCIYDWSLISISSWYSVSCKIYMIFDLYLLMVRWSCKNYMICWSVSPHGSVSCSTTWSLIIISSCFSVCWSLICHLYLHGSLPCKNYMIVDLYLLMVQCHVRTTSSFLYLLMVQCSVRTTWLLICISSWFSVM